MELESLVSAGAVTNVFPLALTGALMYTIWNQLLIGYTLQGACYLNFKNLDSPGSDLKNIWVNDLDGEGRPIIRFRGHPDTYDEAVKEQKKIAIELMKKGQLDWI